jgi:hypothetical protein
MNGRKQPYFPKDSAFVRGFAVAIGILESGWGESSLAANVAHEGGFYYEDFVEAMVDPYDLRLLREAGVKRRDGKKHRKEPSR